jgi:hypothetical protein
LAENWGSCVGKGQAQRIQFVWWHAGGEEQKKLVNEIELSIDHVNQNKKDNRACNLWAVSPVVQACNPTQERRLVVISFKMDSFKIH